MDDSDPWLLLLRLAAGAAIILLVFWVLFSRHADFVIDVRRGQVRCRGKIPLVVQQRLTQFLLDDLAIKNSVRILGVQRGNRMQVWFRGRISPGEQQRIRNFLVIGP
jgi:hypothetical protein